MKKLESTPLNMVLSLTGICLAVGCILSGVQLLTAGPIAQAETESRQAAIRAVMPPYRQLVSDTLQGFARYRGYDQQHRLTGTAVQAVGNGFGGPFTVMVGFRPDGAITGYQVLQHTETPGLGAKMTQAFQTALTAWNPCSGPMKVKQDGGEVDAITAATISSRAFLAAVNQACSVARGEAVYDGSTSATGTAGCEQPQPVPADTVVVDSVATEQPVAVPVAPRPRTPKPAAVPEESPGPAPEVVEPAPQVDTPTAATPSVEDAPAPIETPSETVQPAPADATDEEADNGKSKRKRKRNRNSHEDEQ